MTFDDLKEMYDIWRHDNDFPATDIGFDLVVFAFCGLDAEKYKSSWLGWYELRRITMDGKRLERVKKEEFRAAMALIGGASHDRS
jgi:hypothetical protein